LITILQKEALTRIEPYSGSHPDKAEIIYNDEKPLLNNHCRNSPCEFLQPGTLQGQIYSCLKQKNHSTIKSAIFILTIQDAVAYTKKQHQHSIARLQIIAVNNQGTC
jgi:hypothetical protein